ncbi:MAG: hypothetical protein ACK452_15080 [Bacteroidota bacterium]|jgi:hypothetical protein
MAKNLNFCIGKNKFSASIAKVDREKVYGFVEEQVLDKNGDVCITGNLLEDGQTLILSGATAIKTVADNNSEVDKKKLNTVYLDGKDALLVPSSYDADIELKKVATEELFNLEVSTVYQLTFEDESVKTAMLKDLTEASIYRFVFNYRADYEGADALLLSAQNEVFVLTGRMLDFEYLENKTIAPVIEETNNAEEQEEELDFGML